MTSPWRSTPRTWTVFRSQHLDVQSRDREAPFVVHPLTVRFDDLRVDDGERLVAEIPHHDLLLHADLGCGERETIAGVVERGEHVVDQPDDLAIHVVDEARLRFQDGVTEGADLVRHPDRLRAVTADGDDPRDARKPGQPQYFAEDPGVASDPITIDVTLPDTAFTLQTDRGVFARGQLDAGTSLLLRTALPLSSTGDVLDIGCGAGPIALAMARRSPHAIVWAIDVNERARSLCAHNAERNGISNMRVCAPDDVPAEVRFDTIWSNPPIRIGKPAAPRAVAALARPADASGVCGVGRPEAPRCRLAPDVADPARPADRAHRLQGRLPRARHPPFPLTSIGRAMSQRTDRWTTRSSPGMDLHGR